MFQGDRKVSKGFNWFVQSCCFGALIRGLQNLGTSCERNVFRAFCVVQKEPKSTRGEALRPTIQIAGRYGVFVKMTGIHQVTGFAKSCNFAGYRRQ